MKSVDRYESRVIGSAGQGSLLAAYVLATAAAEEGYHVTQTASYGAAMRSGVSMGDVVLADAPIDFPKVFNLDAIIIQSQEAYEKMREGDGLKMTKDGALIIVDSDLVNWDLPEGKYRVVKAPIAKTATDVVGKRQTMNIVALGVFQVASDGLISKESFLKAVEKAVPKKFVELNKKAFEEGVRIGAEVL